MADELLQQRNLVVVKSWRGQRRVRRQHRHAVLRRPQFGARSDRREHGLLDEEQAPAPGETRHDVLRTLPEEMPAGARRRPARSWRVAAVRTREQWIDRL